MPGRPRGRRPPGDQTDPGGRAEHLEIAGDLDRHAVEALHLELRRLARRHGVEIAEFRATLVTDKRVGSRDDAPTRN